MKISFELDHTLFTDMDEFPVEKQNMFQKVLRFEKLRLGTVDLMQEIIGKGNEVWIYTSSSRPKHYIYELFLRHGIKVSGIVNRKKHVTSLSVEKRAFQKFPPGFDIDVHVDHSENVKVDGNIFGFKIIQVSPDNENWVEDVKKELYALPVS